MSEDTSSSRDYDSAEETVEYSVTLNGAVYEMSDEWRENIERRAKLEYDGNEQFSCWWKVATDSDAEESEIHEVGDPILVIETVGRKVPWDRLDTLEMEEQTTDAFDGVQDADGSEEKDRTHFEMTPQEFEEVPSPEGEDIDKVPQKPEELDESSLVMWVPDHPDITHTWDTGEAIMPMSNWVEWNVQARADQPRPVREKEDSHDHFESLAQMYDSEKIREVSADSDSSDSDTAQSKGPSGSKKRKGEDWFNGEAVGDRWNV